MAFAVPLTKFTSVPLTSAPPLHSVQKFSFHVPLNTGSGSGTSIARTRNQSFRESRTRDSISVRAMASASGSGLDETVNKTVAENPLVVYSQPWCPYCSEVKSLFKRLGVEPLVFELDEMGPEGQQLLSVLERLTGQRTVPNIFIGGKHIGGCSDTVELYQKGELEPLLSGAKAKKAAN